jgi:hypothetical protein
MDGLVVDEADGLKKWYVKGLLHRLGGPAFEKGNYKQWWEYGMLHRLNGPAVDEGDGHEAWYLKGRLHRLDGPAIQWPEMSSLEWYVNGERHRLDGPAIEDADGHKEWWLWGTRCTEAQVAMMAKQWAQRRVRACRLLKFRWLIPRLYDPTTRSGQRRMEENYTDTLALYEERRAALLWLASSSIH